MNLEHDRPKLVDSSDRGLSDADLPGNQIKKHRCCSSRIWWT